MTHNRKRNENEEAKKKSPIETFGVFFLGMSLLLPSSCFVKVLGQLSSALSYTSPARYSSQSQLNVAIVFVRSEFSNTSVENGAAVAIESHTAPNPRPKIIAMESLLIFALLFLVPSSSAVERRLLIVGGALADDNDDIYGKMVELAGGQGVARFCNLI